MLLDEGQAPLQAALQIVDVVAQFAQALVVGQMLVAVVTFLADEAADLFLQYRVFDLFAEQAYRLDEETFAIGEQHRHGVEHVGLEGIAAVPVAGQGIGQVEVQLAWADFQTFGGGTGHGGLPVSRSLFLLWPSMKLGEVASTMGLWRFVGQGYLLPNCRSFPAMCAAARFPR